MTPGGDPSVWSLLRLTPARAMIAASLIVAAGITFAHRHTALNPGSVMPPAQSGQQPPRSVMPAPGVAIPTPQAEEASAQSANLGNAAAEVLAGRASIVAQRDSEGPQADRTRAGVGQLAAGAAIAAARVTVAAKAADSVGRSALMGRTPGSVPIVAPRQCYLVESASPATWGSVHLPMIVALDSSGTDARILTTSGGETEARASLQYNGADSAVFRLRRIGYSGSMTLAATNATLTGSIRSSAGVTLGPTSVTARLVNCPAPRAR